MLESRNTGYTQVDLRAFDLLKSPIWVMDLDNQILWWANQASFCLWQIRTREDLQSEAVRDRLARMPSLLSADLPRVRQGETLTVLWWFDLNGQPTPVNCQISGIDLADGRLALLMVGTIGDRPLAPSQPVTEVDRADAPPTAMPLSASLPCADSLKGIFDNMKDAVVAANPAGEIFFVNAVAKQIWGDCHYEIGTSTWQTEHCLYHVDLQTPCTYDELPLVRALRGETFQTLEYGVRSPHSPHTIWMQFTGNPLRDKQGVIQGGIIVGRDISRRKQTEIALQKSEATNRALLETIPDLMIRMRRDGTYLDFIPAKNFKTIMPAPEMHGTTIFDVMPMHIAQQRLEYVEQALQTGELQIYEYDLQMDGTWYAEEARIAVSGEDEVLVIIRDISDRKRIETERNLAEQALRKQQQFLRDVIDLNPNLIFVKDGEGRFTLVNQAFADLYSRSVEELIGKTNADFLPNPAEIEQFAHNDRTVLSTLQPVMVPEETTMDATGAIHWMQTFKKPILSSDGETYQVVSVSVDITAHRQTAMALRDSERRYAILAEISPVGIFQTDVAGYCLYVNEQWCQMAGLRPNEALGQGWLKAIYASDRPAVLAAWETAMQTHTHFHLEYRFQRPDTSMIWVLGQAVEELDASGTVVGYVGTITDISDRKQAEAVLQRTNEVLELKVKARTLELEDAVNQYRTLVEQIPGVVYTSPLSDATFKFAYVSPQIQQLLGVPQGQWQAGFFGSWAEYIHPDDRDRVLHTVQTSIANQTPFQCEYRLVDQAGNIIWVQDHARIVLAADGTTQVLQGLALNINDRKRSEHDRKQAEAALQRSEARYRRIVETATEGIWEIDANNHTTFVNQRMADLLGDTPQAVLGKSVLDFMDDAAQIIASRVLEWQYHGIREQHDVKFRRKDGSTLWALVSAQPIMDSAGNYQGALGLVMDISDRRKAEAALRDSEARLRLALQAAQMGTWDWDIHSQNLIYSNQLNRMFGLALDTAYPTYKTFLKTIHPSDRPQVSQAVRQALYEHTDYEVAFRARRQDGTYRWMGIKGKVYRNDQGMPIRLLGVAMDITVQKQAEAKMLKALQKEKELNELKSRFVSITSHEFRTPLTTIQSSLDLLERYPCDATEQQALFQQSRNAVAHMVQLLEDILVIGQTEIEQVQLKPTWVHLKPFCHSLIRETQLSAKSQCAVIFQAQGDNDQVYLDQKMLRQILTNLLSNAIKYSANTLPIQLDLICEHATCDPNQIRFQVQDHGMGIPAEDLPHVFEFFHRANNVGKISGTGLGLAIVKKCLDACGGNIFVNSKVGVGTTVTVVLPRIFRSE